MTDAPTQRELFPPEASTEACPVLQDARARAHTDDPATAFEAAQVMDESGVAERNRDLVLAIVKAFPGRSSKELPLVSGSALDRYEFARRLPELRGAGLVGHKRASVGRLGTLVRSLDRPGEIECVKFNSTVHLRAGDDAMAWWPVEGEG